MSEAKFVNKGKESLDWIKLREEIGGTPDDFLVETGTEKFIRKVKENPLVPIGILATTGCLSYGLYSFRKGERKMSQLMMRARVVAQGFTLLALVGGVLLAAKKTDLIKKD